MGDICDRSDVLFSTALNAGVELLDVVDIPVVFLDEAAQCNETVSLVPLMKGSEHLVLIGDHKQLPAVCLSKEAEAKGYNTSLFERLMLSSAVPSVMLNVQFRMRPDIARFPNDVFYDSALINSALVATRRGPSLHGHPFLSSSRGQSAHRSVAFIDHTFPDVSDSSSRANFGEIDIITHLVSDLIRRDPRLTGQHIGVISPYWSQTQHLKERLDNLAIAEQDSDLIRRSAGIECMTVDGFQGREKDIIILSTVRSNLGGYIGFLADPRRLCVALTRARHALFVVGNASTLGGARKANIEQAPEDPLAYEDVWSLHVSWLRREGLIKQWSDDAL